MQPGCAWPLDMDRPKGETGIGRERDRNMNPRDMKQIIDGKRYNTKTATLLAGNDYWDGHNFERSGRQTFLFRTANGAYFAQHLTQWQGERDRLEPLGLTDARALYEGQLTEHRVEWEEAFPGCVLEEA
jgi:hypothetical protein